MVTQKEEKERQKISRDVATVFIGDTDAFIISTMIFLGMFITFLFAYVGNKVLKN